MVGPSGHEGNRSALPMTTSVFVEGSEARSGDDFLNSPIPPPLRQFGEVSELRPFFALILLDPGGIGAVGRPASGLEPFGGLLRQLPFPEVQLPLDLIPLLL